MHEKCGVFGVYGEGLDAARMVYYGLFSLQHRGQESSGIASSTTRKIYTHKGMGLVSQVHTERDIKKLRGHLSIGHNRYSTSLGSSESHCQPVTDKSGILALAHNGNLPSVKKLKAFLNSKDISTKNLNDSELMFKAIKYYYKKGSSIEESIAACFPLFTGVFCLLVLTKDKIVALRDRCGIRPLCIGKVNNGFVISSETCGLDTVGAMYLREVKPGEMVVIGKDGLQSYQIVEGDQKLDIFEFVYFARMDSILLEKSVYKVRQNFGIALAKENPVDADVVIPIPESAIPVALGFSKKSKIPFEYGLTKNRYVGRTFILPQQNLRNRQVDMKLSPIPEVLKGKRVVLIDDSIVRGTTIAKIVKMIRNAGAIEVHVMISCPPVKYPDFYGIDTPSQKELIGANMSVEQICNFLGADSLYFLSLEGLIKSTGLPKENFSTSCFTGIYPIDIAEKARTIIPAFVAS